MLVDRRLPLRYIFSKIHLDIFYVVALAVLMEVGTIYAKDALPQVPVSLAAFLGTAISLILSFKLGQSYQRWWEARKIWGAIVNESRTLTRQLLSFCSDGSRRVVDRVARRQIAWCYVLGQSLRQHDWKKGTAGHLRDEDAEEAERHDNRPLLLLQQHARDVSQLAEDGELSDYQRVAVDDTLTRLTDAMGKAERIKSTVFPTAYRLYLHYFIYIFILVLVLALADLKGPNEVFVVTIIALPFFLLEKTATYLQNPFSGEPTDTSVTAIARVIEINLLQLLGEDDVPDKLEPEDFYLM